MFNTTENTSAPTQHEPPTVLHRMSDAINTHDIDAFLMLVVASGSILFSPSNN